MNSDAALRQIENLLNDYDVDRSMLYDTSNTASTRKDASRTGKLTFVDTYDLMMWWRHFSHVKGIPWITTFDERRIEHHAHREGIQKCNHGQLQKKFGDYDDSSDSSDDGHDQPPAQCTARSLISFEKSLIFNLSSLKQDTLLKPLVATDKRKFDEVYKRKFHEVYSSSSSSSD